MLEGNHSPVSQIPQTHTNMQCEAHCMYTSPERNKSICMDRVRTKARMAGQGFVVEGHECGGER